MIKNFIKFFFIYNFIFFQLIADIQKYYEVYAFENPMFYQTSSNGTDQPLSSYPSVRIMGYDERFWLPLEVKE